MARETESHGAPRTWTTRVATGFVRADASALRSNRTSVRQDANALRPQRIARGSAPGRGGALSYGMDGCVASMHTGGPRSVEARPCAWVGV
jgi:hypothetical protein